MIDIKDASNIIRLSTKINEGSKRKFTLMKEDYITLKFSVENPVYFKLGDKVDNELGLFEVTDIQKPSFNERTGGYDYELRLDAYYLKWKNKIIKYTPEKSGSEASWNLTAPIDVHLGVFLRNLTALGYKYRATAFTFSIDSTVENSAKLVQYDKTNLIDALTKYAEAWKCEWWITDSIIHFGRCEYGATVNFEHGVNVSSMSRSEGSGSFATRIYAFGSTRNIPADYRPSDESAVVNGIVQKRLMLPAGTISVDAHPDMSQEEAIEDVVVFEDVYPHRVGTLSSVSTHEYTDVIKEDGKPDVVKKWNAYRFKDAGITFSKDYVLKGQELRISFQSGVLNGMEFAVTFNPYDKEGGEKAQPEKNADGTWNVLAQVFEIVRNEDYGRPIPADVLIPKNGDTYVLYGFDTKFVADTMIPAAEQELLKKAKEYVEKSKIDPSTYECKMAPDYIYNNGTKRTFDIGDRVNLINKAYFESGRQSRIIGYEYPIDIPYDNPTYTVGETAPYSRIGEIEDKIDALTYKGQTYTGGNGSGVYLITSNDVTQASDRNAYSAKRALKLFLSKTSPDSTSHLLSLLGGALVQGGLTVDRLFSPGFIEGLTGTGFGINEYGEAWMKSLHLTSFLEVPELRYNRVDITIGDQWRAPGGGMIESVDTVNKIITLKLEEGETGTIAADDICMGIYHASDSSGNASSTTDDSRGNRTFAGFYTCYFRVVQVLDAGTQKRFVYALRPADGSYPVQYNPSAMMSFVGYGNFTNKERQSSSYATRTYTRFLRSVSTWEFSAYNIAMQFGDLGNLKAFGIDMAGYSAYLDSIYMSGKIDQSAHIPDRMEVESSNGSSLHAGESTVLKPYCYNAWDDVTAKYTSWLWTRDSGDNPSDSVWNIAHKDNGKDLSVSFSDLNTTRAVFTCTANKAGGRLTVNVTI